MSEKRQTIVMLILVAISALAGILTLALSKPPQPATPTVPTETSLEVDASPPTTSTTSTTTTTSVLPPTTQPPPSTIPYVAITEEPTTTLPPMTVSQSDVVISSSGVTPVSVNSSSTQTPIEYWDRMAQCETGGNWQHFPYGTWTGGLGIYNQTWLGWGGGEFAPTAGQASKEQQIIVAERIAADVGYSAWGCVHSVGYP